MAKISIPLNKTREQLETLFAWPNIRPTPGEAPADTLEETILHWFGQTLERDGLSAKMVSVTHDSDEWAIHLDGPSNEENSLYSNRLPSLLEIGWQAWERTQNVVKPNGKWDPTYTGDWRFFLTLGVGIANFRTLQLFHYPPARLLDPLRDSMHDPVTFRCRDLLEANGVAPDQTRLYETRINSTPIAAPDNQGTPQPPYRDCVKPDPVTGSYIPIEYYTQFQQQMIQLYLHPHPTVSGYTIPMIVYGRTPRMQLAGEWLGPDCAAVLQMLPSRTPSPHEMMLTQVSVDTKNYLRTPVLGSNHPYLFFAIAQIDEAAKSNVGSARLNPKNIEKCISVMQDDLAVVRWQVQMAEVPSQNPWDRINESKTFWRNDDRLLDVCALIWRQASLYYAPEDPFGNYFTFRIDDWKKAKQQIRDSKLNPIEFLHKNAGRKIEPSDSTRL